MPHALTELKLAEVTRPASEPAHEIRADVCVVGAGIAGLSAAIESARLHRDVVLVDSLPLIGGQMVHSLIGLFCGVFGNGPEYRQLTHGIFDDIFRDLGPAGDLHFQPGHTKTVYYNEVALGRWLERTIRSLGVRTILGTVLQRADLRDGRITEIELASRYGNVTIAAHGFVDASGDAALTWQAGLPCWVPERPIYGSQQVIVENVDESHKPELGRDRRPAGRPRRRARAAAPRRAGLLLPRPGHRGAERDPHRGAAGPGGRLAGPVRRARPGRHGDRAAAVRVPQGVRRGQGPCLRLPGPAADPLDQGPSPADHRRGAARDLVRGRGGPNGLADRAPRPLRRLRVGDVRPGPRALRAAARHDPAGRAQPGGGRPVRGRRRRRAVQRAGDGPVRRHGRGRRARPGPRGPGQRARRRPGPAA